MCVNSCHWGHSRAYSLILLRQSVSPLGVVDYGLRVG